MTSNYFTELNTNLRKLDRSIPYLIIDLDALDHNLKQISKDISSKDAFRIVAKSLPSPHLLHYVQEKTGSNKLMVFHQPFLSQISSTAKTNPDILLGKPMPTKTAKYYLTNHKSAEFNPYQNVQWLIDTQNRLQEYNELATGLDQKLKVNLEINVGLHRGGFDNLKTLSDALTYLAEKTNNLELSGLMGYDPHVVKLPSIVRSQAKAFSMANVFYEKCKSLLRQDFPSIYRDDLIFNGAGSPTITLHKEESPLNDLSAGSCLVKPTTFDLPSLKAYKPASFIAAPVLKKLEGTSIPGMEGITGMLPKLSKRLANTYFTYGGFWKADYCAPEGVKANSLFMSTNQTMINAPSTTQLEVDDYVFLRPHQSEFVFLQFGKILAHRKGAFKVWDCFKGW